MKVIAPELETLPERCPEPDLLFRAFLVGDLLLCAPPEQRDALAPAGVPGWAELETLAAHIGAIPPEGRTLGIVGEPFTLFTLHDGVPDTLEQEGWRLLRAPLSEYLWFLWRDAGSSACGSGRAAWKYSAVCWAPAAVFPLNWSLCAPPQTAFCPDFPEPMAGIVWLKGWS